ncbi:MAG: type II secretion system protein [Candidatus Gastranaerophilaceae bacterium]|jgi:prepilin-type N-terminal cleavage/methylation domain-containing protein
MLDRTAQHRQVCYGFINRHCEWSEAIQKTTINLFGLLRLKPRNDRPAFTLAEVLLTLTIIGIIAAMTIPGLMNSTNKMENVVALKKAYSTLMQTTLMITADNGGDITSVLSGLTSDADHEGLANIFIQKLSIAKNCGITELKDTGCFPNLKYKFLDGITDWENVATNSTFSTILTNDSMSYAFVLWRKNCSLDRSSPVNTTSSPLYNTCGIIYVDINGPNKGSSVTGRDLFSFMLTKKGIFPFGAYPDKGGASNCSVANGSGCTNKVLSEGAMNY